ncbi:MAG: hypothetical protein J5I98_13065 [Phaeodactylibacter sp.]|nr:hypothetical protein [Phaeodactylibacter sp.]
MKTLINTCLLAAFFYLPFMHLAAQGDAPQRYYAIDYMKVEPGKHDDYLKLEKAWKKIHEANIKAGKYSYWTLTSVLYPSGANEAYNYVTRINFSGEKQLADYLENWAMPGLENILTKEERDMVARTPEFRTLVRSEIWARADQDVSEDMSDANVMVFNFFNFPETGSRTDHMRVEREIWKPVHKARREAGEMKGWVLLAKQLPYGSADAYHDATVDIYANMEQFLNQGSPLPYFEKVHAGKDVDKLLAETEAAADLIRAEVRMKVDEAKE